MTLKPGDWITTSNGQIGKVIHTSRMTVFVAFPNEGKADSIGAFLESQLKKTDPPPGANA